MAGSYNWRMDKKMEKYIELQGTKEQIINQLIEQNRNIDGMNGLTKKDIGSFLDIVEKNRDLLSDDEIFEKRVPDYDGNTKFITTNAEYYISIKNITLEIILFIISSTTPLPTQLISRILGIKTEGAYIAKLDSTLGESCIMLEAVRKKKRGINKSLFNANYGECVNSNLHCNYNVDDKCTCDSNNVEDICERLVNKKILMKKKNYFYIL